MSKIHEMRLSNFRCFRGDQSVRMAPLTFLIGDNSTGKTSFLAAINAIHDFFNLSYEVDFRAPYNLGAFSEIVHNPNASKNRNTSFQIGFDRDSLPCQFGDEPQQKSTTQLFQADVKFEPDSIDTPRPTSYRIQENDLWLKVAEVSNQDRAYTSAEFGNGTRSWRVNQEVGVEPEYSFEASNFYQLKFFPAFDFVQYEKIKNNVESINSNQAPLSLEEFTEFKNLFHAYWLEFKQPVFAGAPVRSNPQRTYEPSKLTSDSEGSHMPNLFAHMHRQEQTIWENMKKQLSEFGTQSGLFDDIDIRNFGNSGDPFQL